MLAADSHASETIRTNNRVFPFALAAARAGNSNAEHKVENKNGQTAGVGPGEKGFSQGRVTATKAIKAVMC